MKFYRIDDQIVCGYVITIKGVFCNLGRWHCGREDRKRIFQVCKNSDIDLMMI